MRIAAQHTARGNQSERVAASGFPPLLELAHPPPGLADLDHGEAAGQAHRELVAGIDEGRDRRTVEAPEGVIDAGRGTFMGEAPAPPGAAQQPVDFEIGKMRRLVKAVAAGQVLITSSDRPSNILATWIQSGRRLARYWARTSSAVARQGGEPGTIAALPFTPSQI